MDEITRLKAIIKRRDNKIDSLKEKLENLEFEFDNIQYSINELREERKDFLQTLINFLDLDIYIKDVVRRSI